MRYAGIIAALFVIGLFSASAFAEPTIEIVMEQTTFSYGDKLVYSIIVSEVTGEPAFIIITDENGKSGSPIPIAIKGLETIVPSLYPFESEIYPLGKYSIEVNYSGASNIAEFNLIDSGKIVIPFWIKQLTYFWVSGQISDISYADGLEFLIENEIIIIPKSDSIGSTENVHIPSWVKQNAQWWIEEKITDDEFAKAIQYLIKVGIIVIGEEFI